MYVCHINYLAGRMDENSGSAVSGNVLIIYPYKLERPQGGFFDSSIDQLFSGRFKEAHVCWYESYGSKTQRMKKYNAAILELSGKKNPWIGWCIYWDRLFQGFTWMFVEPWTELSAMLEEKNPGSVNEPIMAASEYRVKTLSRTMKWKHQHTMNHWKNTKLDFTAVVSICYYC